MYIPVVPAFDQAILEHRLPAFYQPNWYAVQTGANQEKQVVHRLQEKGIESLLPLYEQASRRTDRKIVLQLPLFPGYVFARIALRDRLKILVVPRVVRLVGFGPIPAAIRDSDIDALRAGLEGGKLLPHPYLTVGRPVRVVAGPFEGMCGVLVRRKNSLRVVVAIDAIQRSFMVEVDESEVQPAGGMTRAVS